MADEPADERLPLTESTKRRIDAVKDDGVTYDYWLRQDPRLGGD